MSKRIHCGYNIFATVDDEDYEYLSKFNWHLANGHPSRYAGKSNFVYMVFFIKQKAKNQRYVFIDRDPLNLTRGNIRISTWANAGVLSRKTNKECSSIYKGVCFDKRSGKWLAYLTKRRESDGVRVRVLYKLFSSEEEAAEARRLVAEREVNRDVWIA